METIKSGSKFIKCEGTRRSEKKMANMNMCTVSFILIIMLFARLWTLFVIVLENACGMVEDGTGAVLMTSPSFTLIASTAMDSWISETVQYKLWRLKLHH